MNNKQRKAIFAHIEKQKKIKEEQLVATGKLREWENKEGD